VRVKRVYPDDLETRFVNSIVVQHEREHFILSFYEVFLPIIVGDSEEEKKALFDALEYVEAKCAARLVITPGKMRGILVAMAENLRRYEEKVAAFGFEEEEEEDK
jgi:hypothetical protein